jgi:hypothetical protein
MLETSIVKQDWLQYVPSLTASEILPKNIFVFGMMLRMNSEFSRYSQNCEKRLLASSCLPVRLSAWNNSVPTGRIFMKFDIWGLHKNLSRKLNFDLNLTRITSTSHENLCTFMIISRWILLEWAMFQTKVLGNENTHFLFNSFFSETRAVYEVMWKNMVE